MTFPLELLIRRILPGKERRKKLENQEKRVLTDLFLPQYGREMSVLLQTDEVLPNDLSLDFSTNFRPKGGPTDRYRWLEMTSFLSVQTKMALVNLEPKKGKVVLKSKKISSQELYEIVEYLAFYYPEITMLNVSRNRLVFLPQNILKLRKLERLILNDNFLKVLPNLHLLPKLRYLNVSLNRLSTLPEKLGNLYAFYGALNRFTVFPSSLLRQRRIHTINLNSNDIREIPEEIQDLKGLKILKITYNRLHSLPSFPEKLTTIQIDFQRSERP